MSGDLGSSAYSGRPSSRIDNDGDNTIDFADAMQMPRDPQCTSRTDTSESS